MANSPHSPAFAHITLEQWRALIAVVDAGGYAQAAELLHKSQSSVTYAVQKIAAQLGVKIFDIKGRKAVLTEAGEVLQRRARTLVEEALALERGAGAMAADWKPEIRLAVEIIFPTWLLLECLATFAKERPDTHIELYETVIGGTDEALLQGKVDLVITARVPEGYLGDPVASERFIPVAHPGHPLHQLGRKLSHRDLRRHRHLYIRDTSSQRQRETSWQGEEQRWTVSTKATSIHAVCMGLGFAWFPEDSIRNELAQGLLKPLPLKEGAERSVQLYLVFAERDYVDRDTLRLADIIRAGVRAACSKIAGGRHPQGGAVGKPRATPRKKTGPG
ncbi:MAG TPA: LysR family transcriptional regulator [Usitatibacteraceae bacterium]